ncbi:GNAT family N-acetyltransferase [Cohnella terricola]|uniref:GNAT family N-acetyltransferase n=1 Tax=Cohnella terricola TaxID=1289167 RepID=A0A559JBP1_9BACL|nr:GNAT family N-acetyltransferase [Cohnella terricola]TVX97304.1 GNAT family N-acetyltransferase [Cohnella terricola]
MTIKQASAADTPAIARLILLAIGDIASQLTSETDETKILERLEAFIDAEGNRFSRSCILAKEAKGVPAGMILCYHGKDADLLYEPVLEHLRRKTGNPDIAIDRETESDEYYIDAIAVDPRHQGQGFAKQLIDAAERKAADSGYERIALNVDQTNEKAHALYSKLGYVADKQITINGHSFWHMVKPLHRMTK